MSNKAYQRDVQSLVAREKPQTKLEAAPKRQRILARSGQSGEVLATASGGTGILFPITATTRDVYLQDVTDSAGHIIQQKVDLTIYYLDASGTPFAWPTGRTLPVGATLVNEPAV